MTNPGWNDPADDEGRPARRTERALVRDELEARLWSRQVWLSGRETDEDVVRILDAVEDFEAAVARVGGDSMVNTWESSMPEDERLVLPRRNDDESAVRYEARVRDATRRIGAED